MDTGFDSKQGVIYNAIDIMNSETEKRQPTPAELLFKKLEKPLDTVAQATDVNNGAVKLFIEGHLTVDQLTKFSLGLARRADELADKIFHTDMSTKKCPKGNRWHLRRCKPSRWKIEDRQLR